MGVMGNTNINVDDDLKAKAKERFMNISELTNRAIRERLAIKEVDTSCDNCDFCGRKEKKATAKDLIGMTWLCPDEKWICSHCLEQKKRGLIKHHQG